MFAGSFSLYHSHRFRESSTRARGLRQYLRNIAAGCITGYDTARDEKEEPEKLRTG